jgi:hypothetical protein
MQGTKSGQLIRLFVAVRTMREHGSFLIIA